MSLYQVVEKDGAKTIEPINLCCGLQQEIMNDALQLTVDLKQSLGQELFSPIVATVADKIAAAPFTMTITGGEPAIAALTLDHYEIEYNGSTITNTTGVVELDATGIAVGVVMVIKVRAVDNLGNTSSWVTVNTTVSEVTINAPIIIAPANGSEFSASDTSLTVTTSAFSIVDTGLPDTHAHTVFTLKKGGTVIATYEAGTVTQYTFTGLTLEPGTNYTAEAYFIGASGAQSPVGSSTFTVKESWVTSDTGERLKLNDTGDGVLCYYTDPYDNVEKLMAIALADQRGTSEWMSSPGHNKDIPGLTNISAASVLDPHSAKYNTDAIYVFADDLAVIPSNAAMLIKDMCRIAGTACSLPNIQQVQVIWKVRGTVDSLDNTIASYPNNILSNWGFADSMKKYCWSSSEVYDSLAWSVNAIGNAYSDFKNITYGFIPILELNPTTLQPI